MPRQSRRPSLYSSAIQHVLVLQEEEDDSPTLPPPHTIHPHRLWHSSHQNNNPLSTLSPTDPASPAPTSDTHTPDVPTTRTTWRVHDRTKTRHALLVYCLNIGVDPPDVKKPNPCAILECWIAPNTEIPGQQLPDISAALKDQYARWADSDTRFRAANDPTVSEIKRLSRQMRAAAGDQRLLFHYNGHGVPKPTSVGGELWVFNSTFSQYIPLNIYDLHSVLGSPTIYIFDCHSAGTILHHFLKSYHHANTEANNGAPPLPTSAAQHNQSVFLAACRDGQLLPSVPYIPADMFTACLTTPIKMALRWFIKRTLIQNISSAMLDRIPGHFNKRNTPLGDLECVFTAVTDTIAWNVLPRDLFKRLYRQDVLLASLMRNFLLAQRIMHSFGVQPVCYPAIPSTHAHPLWKSFDLAMENILSQLPNLIAKEDNLSNPSPQSIPESGPLRTASFIDPASQVPPQDDHHVSHIHAPNYTDDDLAELSNYNYTPSTFFTDQMKAFDVWLDMGPGARDAPEQLPIMLQVLHSSTLRPRALQLISRYMQTGPVAVDESLAVGVFPYMSQLLKNQQVCEIRKDIVFIWSKILALDDSCRIEIVKSKVDEYFVSFLTNPDDSVKPVYLACAIFVLSVIARDDAHRCQSIGALEACALYLDHENSFVRRWSCLCLTEILQRSDSGPLLSTLDNDIVITHLVTSAVNDDASDVRAAAISTLSAICHGVLHLVAKQDETSTPVPQLDGTAIMDSGASAPILIDPPPSRPTVSSNESIQLSLDEQPGQQQQTDGAGSSFMPDSDLLNAVVPPYSREESDALLKIGKVIASIARNESSVLVRREVAMAVADFAVVQQERFNRAALVTDLSPSSGTTNHSHDVANSSNYSGQSTQQHIQTQRNDPENVKEMCEEVYKSLWITLAELAFDPHPIDAAIARRPYDKIFDVVTERVGLFHAESDSDGDGNGNGEGISDPQNSMSPSDNLTDTGSAENHSSNNQHPHNDRYSTQANDGTSDFILPSSQASDSGDVEVSSAVTPDGLGTIPLTHDEWRTMHPAPSALNLSAANEDVSSDARSVALVERRGFKEALTDPLRFPTQAQSMSSPGHRTAALHNSSPLARGSLPPHPSVLRDHKLSRMSLSTLNQARALGASPSQRAHHGTSVHVRSSSGSFDLEMPSRLSITATAIGGSRYDIAMMESSAAGSRRRRRRQRTGWTIVQQLGEDEDTQSEPGQHTDTDGADRDDDVLVRPGSVPKNQPIPQFIKSCSPPWFNNAAGVREVPNKNIGNLTPHNIASNSNDAISNESQQTTGMVEKRTNSLPTSSDAMSSNVNTAANSNKHVLPKSTSTFSGLRLRFTKHWDGVELKGKSPPRPPKRTHSYSVLNATSTLGHLNRQPIFLPSRPTSYFPVSTRIGRKVGSVDSKYHLHPIPPGYNHLYKSQKGNAAQSLYEWSAAYISRAEVEASSLDDSREEEAIPKYATLWTKINKKSGSQDAAEGLRNFALLGKGDDIIGMEAAGENNNTSNKDAADGATGGEDEDKDLHVVVMHGEKLSNVKISDIGSFGNVDKGKYEARNEFSKATELSLHFMAAGGGSVSALAFLPRDTSIGDDQLVATGDTKGAIGIYDARSGKCQVAFGIPVVPGVREYGISSIICLNPYSEDTANSSDAINATSSSHSALILAGSFDGRVAVFKNDFSRPNDFRIMSTFQASGHSMVGRSLFPWKRNKFMSSHRHGRHNMYRSGPSGLASSPQAMINSTLNTHNISNSEIEKLNSDDEVEFESKLNPNSIAYGVDVRRSSLGQPSSSTSSFALHEHQAMTNRMKLEGKGLVISFSPESAYLAAGGVQKESVRVWDLNVEKCIWQGPVVQRSSFPTAVTMWKRHQPQLFVVGSSRGAVRIIDMRQPASFADFDSSTVLGKHAEPIVSVGTCVDYNDDAFGRSSSSCNEVVVSADYGGEIVFWDSRWNTVSSTCGTGGIKRPTRPRGATMQPRRRKDIIDYSASKACGGVNDIVDKGDVDDTLRNDKAEEECCADGGRMNLIDEKRIRAHETGLRTMCIHRNGRFIASGSTSGVKIFGRDGTMLKKITQYTDCYDEDQGDDVANYYSNDSAHNHINHNSNNHNTTNNNQLNSTCTTTTTNNSHIGARGNRDNAYTMHEDERISTSGGNGGGIVKPWSPKSVRRVNLSPVTALAFQQESSLLAVGCDDGKVMIYGKQRDFYPGIGNESS